MTPFGDGQPTEIPYPPQEVPTPTLPGANFADIGAQAAAGAASARPAGWWLRPFIDALAEIIARVATALLNCWLAITRYILQIVFGFFKQSDANMDALVATAVQGMLGLGAGKGTAGGGASAATREQYAANIAAMIQNSIEQNIAKNPDGSLAPGNGAANKFLALSAHIAIEGWVQGLMAEIGSANYLERFGDLKDTLENCLGMGRLARRALAAPIRILVEEPYTQALNQTYQPTLLSPGELVKYYLRNPSDKANYFQQMALHGYNPDRAAALAYLEQLHLSPADLQMLVDSKTITDTDATGRLMDQGYTQTDAAALLLAARNAKTYPLTLRYIDDLITVYAAGKIDATRWNSELTNSGLPEYVQTMLNKIADLKVNTAKVPALPEPKRASLAEGLKLLERGTWQLPDYEQLLNYYNYIPSDEVALATLASEEAIDWQALQLKKAAAEQAAAQKAADRLKKAQMMVEDIGVNTAMFETLIEEGQRTIGQYRQYLLNKSVAPDNVDALANAMVIKIAQKAAAAAAKLAAQNKAKTKNVDLAQLETAVKQGLMDITTFTQRVKALGMSDADAGLIAQELTNSISAAATKAQATAAAKAKAADKGVNLSEEQRAVRLGIVSMNDYQSFLVAHGFDAEEQGVLMMELQDQLTTDKATAAKKAAAATKATTKGISIGQLEKQVRAGVNPIGDYTAALATAGYDAADQASMTQFLQLQMDQDQQDLIVHGHASALVDQLGVSLTDLERAVKLGTVPIATYTDALQRAGVSGPDQQTLTNTLAAQIKTTRAAQTTAQSVSKLVAAAGLSLATLEKDAISGKLSIAQFQSLLQGYNVPADEVASTIALVQDEIDNQKAVQALVAGATAKAAAKGLSLAQDTAAYKAGVMAEADWRARVASLGYDAADVEILFETLAAKTAASTASSSTTATTTATSGTATGNGTGFAPPVLEPLPTPPTLPTG